MEIRVLDTLTLKALHREIKEVTSLMAEIVAPYKALQQATKWLDQQEACQLLISPQYPGVSCQVYHLSLGLLSFFLKLCRTSNPNLLKKYPV